MELDEKKHAAMASKSATKHKSMGLRITQEPDSHVAKSKW